MTIYVDGRVAHQVFAASIDTSLSLASGTRQVTVKAWDSGGATFQQQLSVSVSGASSGGSTSGAITVNSPLPGATVTSPARFVASAQSPTSSPITSMALYVDDRRVHLVYARQMDTTQELPAGTRRVIVKSWDSSGRLYEYPYTINVSGTSGGSATNGAITVNSPLPGATVSSPARFVASAQSQTSFPISSMALYLDDRLVHTVFSNRMDTTQSLATGTRRVTVKSWDNSGRLYEYPYTVTVGSSSTSSSSTTTPLVFDRIEEMSGWKSCDACAGDKWGTGPTATHSMRQGVSDPSLDGSATEFWLGGSTPYANVLWYKQLVSETQVETNRRMRNFVFDLYFYIKNPHAAEGLEWDVNQFIDGMSFIMGTQCSYRSWGTWDVWDNVREEWISTGIRCPVPQAYTWNHVQVEFERTWDNKLRYISVSMNGQKHYLNWYYDPIRTTWSGITVNYQMNGNYRQEHYSTWADRMKLSMW